MTETSGRQGSRRPIWSGLVEGLLGLVTFLLLTELLLLWLSGPAAWRLSAGVIFVGMLAVVLWRLAASRESLGWANRVTLVRGMLVAVIAGAVVFPDFMASRGGAMAGLALAALALDGVDGWVARLTHSVSRFGARFDMELDAFFILVLCAALVALGKAGYWVLAIGALRYGFVAAGWYAAWLRRPLPERRRRKVICVWQVVTLLAGLLPFMPAWLVAALAGVALALLVLSFALDIRWLWQRRHQPPFGAHPPHGGVS